jgi:hypothetical protein
MREDAAQRGDQVFAPHTVGDVRGKLAVPPGADAAAHARAGYVTALEAANASPYGPW